MSTAPIDYAALADQARKSTGIDYAALADQVRSDNANSQPVTPPPAGPKIPPELQGPKDPGFLNWRDPGRGLIGQGVRQIVGGVEHMAQPGKQAKYAGGSDIIGGAGKMLAPVAIGATLPALAAAPAATVAGLAGGTAAGYAGSELAKAGARAINASPEGEQFAGDVAAIPSAVLGGAAAAKMGPVIGPVAKGMANGAWKGATAPSGIRVHGIEAPASVAGAVVGGGLGALSGIPEARAVGTVVGAGVPIVRGMARGAKQGLADYRYSQMLKGGTAVPPLESPAPPDLTPILGKLPSGRMGPLTQGEKLDKYPEPYPAPRIPAQGAAYQNQIPDLSPIQPPSRTLPSGKTVPIPGQPNPIQDAMKQAKKTVDARLPVTAPPDIPAPSAQGPPAPSTGNALADKYYLRGHPNPTAAAARDHALTDWALKQKVDYSDVQPGQPFADMIKQANTDLHKSYRAEIGRADHGQRVQDFKDLLKSKMGPALDAPSAPE